MEPHGVRRYPYFIFSSFFVRIFKLFLRKWSRSWRPRGEFSSSAAFFSFVGVHCLIRLDCAIATRCRSFPVEFVSYKSFSDLLILCHS